LFFFSIVLLYSLSYNSFFYSQEADDIIFEQFSTNKQNMKLEELQLQAPLNNSHMEQHIIYKNLNKEMINDNTPESPISQVHKFNTNEH